MPTDAIIRVRHLSVQYDSLLVLHDISFDVYPGEIFMVVGGSGIGKTTLLNHMIGLLHPSAGHVFIAGDDIITANDIERARILKKIGVMYQNGALFGSMNLLENVALPLEELTKLPPQAIQRIARSKLEMVGLSDFCDYMPAEISGGMRKRAAIARAMVLDPKILFLDEPSSGLDPITSAQLDLLIQNLSKMLGITFFIVSHDLSSINAIADRVIMLHEGKIIASGKPETLRQDCDSVLVRKFFKREA